MDDEEFKRDMDELAESWRKSREAAELASTLLVQLEGGDFDGKFCKVDPKDERITFDVGGPGSFATDRMRFLDYVPTDRKTPGGNPIYSLVVQRVEKR